MANPAIHFSATRLVGTDKVGKLTPDADGYYTMPIGALNAYNFSGAYYTALGAKELFEKSSSFMRRIQSGCLKSELGHPKRLPGMTDEDYLNRLHTIEETNVVAHISDVWLDENYGKNNPKFNNPNLIAIMAKFRPAGPHADHFRASIENGKENVCFSIRSFTKDSYVRGKYIRVLHTIVTFDVVTEPGIDNARKWESPALEEISSNVVRLQTFEKLTKACSTGQALEASQALIMESYEALSDKGFSIAHTLPSGKW